MLHKGMDFNPIYERRFNMTKIFWGFIFIFLDFHVGVDHMKISFIPDFVGYILIYQGFTEFRQESGYFEKARPLAMALSVLTGVTFILDFIGISATNSILSDIFTVSILAIDIYMMYCLISGIGEMEYKEHRDYNAASLKSLWITTVILELVTLVGSYLSLFTMYGIYTTIILLVTVATLAAFVIHIIFLVKFNNTRKRIEYER